jgi:hypothetical protein
VGDGFRQWKSVASSEGVVRSKDRVMLTWEGRVVCPWHGELASDVVYAPGPAPCGCIFEQGWGGVLLAVRALVLQMGGENAGQSCQTG